MAELTIRDWMVIVGVLLILAVLLDAWRRVYRERRAPVRLKVDSKNSEAPERSARDVDLAWLKELPNGGARVVSRAEGDDSDGDGDEAADDPAAAPEVAAETPPESAASAQREPQSKKPSRSSSARREPPPVDEVELVSGMNSKDEPENLDWLDALDATPDRSPQQPTSAQLPRDVDPEVFMLNVVARNSQGFRGDDILHILLACDLRFGDMNFFHRHEQEAGRGPIQFSVANMLQPGVFDIDNMGDFSTQGLVFFVTLPGPEDMMKAFDYMLETAQVVARNLEGDVLDETRSVLTRQTLEHNRQKIRDLERRLLARTR